ncbi:hypothetical protein [Lysinibacillus sp. FJAT-14745]|uniref:hypothetical protein n=1 Tax=Lysinibacillus sp. FJAT-14745 TaxID=1704289 RepID=UPI000A51F2BE|nr:hypothetical protein [Lysinibacillus sp. FJAT-14745]
MKWKLFRGNIWMCSCGGSHTSQRRWCSNPFYGGNLQINVTVSIGFAVDGQF